MRVNTNESSLLLAQMQSSQQALNTAVNQLATGQSVSTPADNAAAFASNLRSLAASANVDRYTKNADSAVTLAQQADSALSGVITSLTQAVSLGTEGASGSLSSTNRSSIATQVQGLLANVLSQANSTSGGQSLFAGAANPTAAFTADPTSPYGFTYNGASSVNQTAIGNTLSVATGVPGDQVFLNPNGNVLGSLNSLITALKSGSTADIASATASVSSAISTVSQQRVLLGNTVNQAQDQETYLSQETLSLSSQQAALTSIDLSTAATNLTQAQPANSAILAVAAKILPVSLLDYLK